MRQLKVYFASGWFTKEQKSTYEEIRFLLFNASHLKVFYPKDESASKQKDLDAESVRKDVYFGNLKAIRESDLVICSTEDKDPGSIFEAGYATAQGIPIVYVNLHLPKGAAFNLMLAQSGIAAVTDYGSLADLIMLIEECVKENHGFLTLKTINEIKSRFNNHQTVE